MSGRQEERVETYGLRAASCTPSTTSYARPYTHHIFAPIGSMVRRFNDWILATVSFAKLSADFREAVLGVERRK
jgi:hypothetical protein